MPSKNVLSAQEYYTLVRNTFRDHGRPEIAEGQRAYMRHQFEFFGLKMPQWMALTKGIHKEHGIPSGEVLHELALLCYNDEHREMQYFALETFQKAIKKEPAESIELLETLILSKSWWDTVDWIAKLVGMHFKNHPALIQPVVGRWMDSGKLWLQRVCLIFQLAYKDKTDRDLLFRCVGRVADSKEFFLQKGAGWALRQYARTDQEAVRAFVEATALSGLTRREALKHVGTRGD